MKKTKIIILVVAALLIIALPALFVIQKTKAKNTPELPIQEEYRLPDISVVVAKNFGAFTFTSGNENKVIVKYAGDKIEINKPFSIHKDTLFMDEGYIPSKKDMSLQMELKSIEKLIVNSSIVYLCNLSSPRLELMNKSGTVIITYIKEKKKEKNKIDNLQYISYNGSLIINNTQTKETKIELRKSKFLIGENVNFKNLSLHVIDSSEVQQFAHKRGNTQNLDLEIDNSSILQLGKY